MQLRYWQSECISKALNKYIAGDSHFLCLATPGAGKTVMASTLANKLFTGNRIDLVLCFSPSVNVSSDFQHALEAHTKSRMDGLLGSKGRSLTYQAMLSLDDSFWKLFDTNRIFVIFDEIHHCAADTFGNANAWGQKIVQKIQGKATYTLALTGTPWRSDQVPIALSQYCHDQKIQCDYIYGLTQAVTDNVCRRPQITLIDNDCISVTQDGKTTCFSSFGKLLTESKCSYQQLIENENVIRYFIDKSSKKLTQIRKHHPDAGGLIVAASVEHAKLIAKILYDCLGENARVATYREHEPQNIINEFKLSTEKWIISVGMISEGTNIPRLRVCCHLTRVKTELNFRQVLGRILRSSNEINGEGFLFMPAEPNLIEYANRVAQEIPEGIQIKVVTINNQEKDINISIASDQITSSAPIASERIILRVDLKSNCEAGKVTSSQKSEGSILAKSYESSINIFGKFKQEIMSLPRFAS